MKDWQRWFLAVVLLLALVGGIGGVVAVRRNVAVQAVAATLQNAHFDGDYYEYGGVGELGLARPWAPWYVEAPGVHRPEYKAELPTSRVCNGAPCGRVKDLAGKSQKQFTTFAKQDGGVRQNVKVEPGKWYRLEGWFYNWSSSEDNSDVSAGSTGGCSGLLGINPWGDWNATYRTTIWGKESYAVYDKWVKVEVIAQAWSDEISLFSRGVCQWPVKHNDFYWDDFRFTEADMDLPVVTPVPPTPVPTFTPTTQVPATPTPTRDIPVGECPTLLEIDQTIRDALRDLELVFP